MNSKRVRLSLLILFNICMVLFLGFGLPKVVFADATGVLEYEDVDVTTEKRTGLFGGKYASFEITGTVTNNTDKTVNSSSVTALIWTDESGHKNKIKPKLSEEKLTSGETCDFTYKDELTVEDGTIPELIFSGKIEFTGLDEAQDELNEQMQAILAGFAKDDQEKEEKKKADEEKADEEKEQKEATKEKLKGCKGMYAIKAYNTAKDTAFEVKIIDSQGNDVTESLKKSVKGDAIRKAEVTDIDFKDAGWFSKDTVKFKINYEDPEKKAKREAREAEKKKAEEERALEDSSTTGQRNALRSAKSYLNAMPFSYSGIIHQLEFEGYSTEDATFAADNCGADWNEQAAKCAESYMNTMSFSRDGLIEQLMYEGFTYEQAEHGAAAVGY